MMSSKDVSKVNDSITVINDWRTLHLIPLEELNEQINSLLTKNKINVVLSSKRLKRLTSIQYKLDINSDMRLGGMQDVGGYRIVLQNIKDLYKTYNIICKNVPNEFIMLDVKDYVEKPKDSGYRSIHFVYKYISDDKDYDGLRIELQIRTKLQHNWATAVETAGLYTKTSLKSSQGDDKWLDYFKVISALFSLKEETNVLGLYSESTMQDLMLRCHEYNSENKFCDILKALTVTVNYEEINKNKKEKKEYYIIYIDFTTRHVTINEFAIDEEAAASSLYSEIEQKVVDKKNAVVFVSVSKLKELRDAYPSYFFDTTEFFAAIDKISENCKLLGWI